MCTLITCPICDNEIRIDLEKINQEKNHYNDLNQVQLNLELKSELVSRGSNKFSPDLDNIYDSDSLLSNS